MRYVTFELLCKSGQGLFDFNIKVLYVILLQI